MTLVQSRRRLNPRTPWSRDWDRLVPVVLRLHDAGTSHRRIYEEVLRDTGVSLGRCTIGRIIATRSRPLWHRPVSVLSGREPARCRSCRQVLPAAWSHDLCRHCRDDQVDRDDCAAFRAWIAPRIAAARAFKASSGGREISDEVAAAIFEHGGGA